MSANKGKKNTGLQEFFGEGFYIPIKEAKTISVGENFSKMGISVDMERVPAPERKFAADSFCVLNHFGLYRLIFGQRKCDGKSIRSLLELRFSLSGLSALAASVNGDESGEISEVYSLDVGEEPDQAIAMEVNFARVGGSDFVLTMDFFYASGLTLTRAPVEKSIALDPAVRIQMPHEMFRSLRNYVAKVVKDANA